jgi:hypothetical protein
MAIPRICVLGVFAIATALCGPGAAHAAPAPGSAGTAVSLTGRSTLKVAGLGKRPSVDPSVSAEAVFAAGEWMATDGEGESYEGVFTQGGRGGRTFFFHYDASSREAVERVVAAWAREMLLARRGVDAEVVARIGEPRVSGVFEGKGRRFKVTGTVPFTATAPELGESRKGTYRFRLAGAPRAVIVGGVPAPPQDGDLRTLEVAVEGQGRVSGTSHTLECDEVCSFPVSNGTAIELEAQPAPGWSLRGFSGCDASNGPVCTLLVSGDRRVTATFAQGGGLASQAVITSLPRQGLASQPFRMTFECVGPICTSPPVFTIQHVFHGSRPFPPVNWSAPTSSFTCTAAYGCTATGHAGELVVPSPRSGRHCYRVKNGFADSAGPWSTERCIEVQPSVVLL